MAGIRYVKDAGKPSPLKRITGVLDSNR